MESSSHMLKLAQLHLFIFVVFLLSLQSCTTKFKRAQELMTEKNYDEALAIMDELVARDPSDSDYQVGLKDARLGVISQSLIKVRMTRLAQNNNESWELLRKVFEQQNNWNLFPTGAVAFTQTEEIDEAFKNLKAEINQLDRDHKPLRILYLVERYKILFGEAKRKSFESSVDQARKDSRKYCVDLAKIRSNQTYYLNMFTNNLCNYLGLKIKAVDTEPEMYNQIRVSTDPKSNIPSQFATAFKMHLDKKMEKSGWINSQSDKTMALEIGGDYFFREITTREPRTHTYYEKIRLTNPNGTVSEHDEPRYFYYSANVVIQDFSTDLVLVNSDSNIIILKDLYESNARRTYHDYSNYAINLHPESTGFSYSESEWREKALNQIANKYLKNIENIYDQKFCQSLSENQKRESLLNQSLKCIQQTVFNDQPKSPPDLVRRTFEKEFAMNTQEFETLFRIVW